MDLRKPKPAKPCSNVGSLRLVLFLEKEGRKNPRGSDFEMYAWHFLTRSFLFLHERASSLEGRFKAPAAVRTHTRNEIPFSSR